jgi:short-subunit dehydrogenase
MTPAEVARVGYEAMLAGKPLVVAGIINQLMVWSTRFVPRQFAAKLAGNLMQPH